MNPSQFQSLLLSGWIDFMLISPMGMLGGWFYFRKKASTMPLLLVSLAMALYSAYVYIYLHMLYHSFPGSIVNLLVVWLPFLPVLALAIVLSWQLSSNFMQEKTRN